MPKDGYEGAQEARGTEYADDANPKDQPGSEATVHMGQDHVGTPFTKQGNDTKRGSSEGTRDVPKGYVGGADTNAAVGGVSLVNKMGSGTMRKIEDPNGARDAEPGL
jgi:hypothetical protein